MQVSRTAASSADRQFAGEMRFGASRERGRLLMADMHPLNLVSSANRVRDSVERIAADSVNALNSGFQQNIYKQVSYSLCHVTPSWTPQCLDEIEQVCLQCPCSANRFICTLRRSDDVLPSLAIRSLAHNRAMKRCRFPSIRFARLHLHLTPNNTCVTINMHDYKWLQ